MVVTTPKKVFNARLPPDLLDLIDADVEAGKVTSRNDLLFRAVFLYYHQNLIVSVSTDKFREMFYSEEFKDYVKEIVRDENNRMSGNHDPK